VLSIESEWRHFLLTAPYRFLSLSSHSPISVTFLITHAHHPSGQQRFSSRYVSLCPRSPPFLMCAFCLLLCLGRWNRSILTTKKSNMSLFRQNLHANTFSNFKIVYKNSFFKGITNSSQLNHYLFIRINKSSVDYTRTEQGCRFSKFRVR
jgi:hypothetical protein